MPAAAAVLAATAPWTTGGALPNFAVDEGTAGFRRCFDTPTWDRLVALADRYDPARVFRVGQVARREAADASTP